MYSVATNGRRSASAIRRIEGGRTYWRVTVESWPADGGYRGRFVFEPEGSARDTFRAGPAVLTAGSMEELVRAAHDVSDDALRALCRSLA
jgi:hypothetical protein